MKITPSFMKKYHADSIEITKEMQYPPAEGDWSPHMAFVVLIYGGGWRYRASVDCRLCACASAISPMDPTAFAVLEALQNFKGYIENLAGGPSA